MQFIKISLVYYYFIAYSVVVRIPLKSKHFVLLFCSLHDEENGAAAMESMKIDSFVVDCVERTEAICWDKHCSAICCIIRDAIMMGVHLWLLSDTGLNGIKSSELFCAYSAYLPPLL